MKRSTLCAGKEGEERACLYLRSLGYALYGRNVRLGRDEIDIIAYDSFERCVAFTEVKFRTRRSADYAADSLLTITKKKKLLRSARAWVAQKEYEGSYRIDALLLDGSRVTHVRGIECEDYA